MKYLYAITGDRVKSWQEDEKVISCISEYGLGMIVTETSQWSYPVLEKEVWHHEKVLENLMQSHDILPVRYGTVLKDLEEAVSLLSSYSGQFKDNLTRISGCVEMGLRIFKRDDAEDLLLSDLSPKEADHTGLTPGERYMHEKWLKWQVKDAKMQKEKQFSDEIHNSLLTLAKEGKYSLTQGRLFFNGAYLVKKNLVASFQVQLDKIKNHYQETSFWLSGPWPPYNFVNIKIEGGEKNA